MYPERLPAHVESGAERRLFELFRTEFSDDFVVFHGVTWLARNRGKAHDGETDFIVAHPRYGVLVIEVKGGGIKFDASTGRYTSTDRYGQDHDIKDPFNQARVAKYALRDKLQESDNTRGCNYSLGHAVCFPDIPVAGNLGLDAPAAIVIDSTGLRDFKQRIIEAFRFHGMGNDPLGEQAVEALVGLIGRSWQIETPIGTELESEEKIIRLLTEQQFNVLDVLGTRRRALISGCAGSGKTMLAMEKARRLAEEGYSVLLTCFNRSLESWLKSQLQHPNITVHRFLSLCAVLSEKAGKPVSKRPSESEEDFYGRFPDLLIDALDALSDRFDAIIVDEGQDFSADMWAALTSLLWDEDDGTLYIFYDDNQRLYGNSTFPITDEPFPLMQNRRNTQHIHEAVMLFYQSEAKPNCIGPEGRPPHALKVPPGSNEKRCVEEFITGLVTEGQVKPGDIAVLTRRGQENSRWSPAPSYPAWSATWDLADCGDKVICSSIHGFKGLERPVVIACELQGVNAARDVELLYVAFSRAREYLVVVGADDLVG